MRLTPDYVIKDLEEYINKFGLRFSCIARKIFYDTEKHCHKHNCADRGVALVISLIENIPSLRKFIDSKGGNSNLAIFKLNKQFVEDAGSCDNYEMLGLLYSNQDNRNLLDHQRIIDLCMDICVTNFRNEINEIDILEAFIKDYEKEYPILTNNEFTDKRLQTSYTTLSHTVATYIEPLWINLKDIYNELCITNIHSNKKNILPNVPLHIKGYIEKFLYDYPDYKKNIFLIMSFSSNKFNNEIYRILKKVFEEYGFNLLRADEKNYTNDLLSNIETYLYGCNSAVAVFERISNEIYNPNVSIEVGFCLGSNKPICLLKEKTLPKLPSDLIGKLYYEFSLEDMETSIPREIKRWLVNQNML